MTSSWLQDRVYRHLAVVAALVATAALSCVSGCSKDEPAQSAPVADADVSATVADADVLDDAQDTESDVVADAGGPLACPAPAVASGAVRARTLACVDELPTGEMAAARVGDFVLENAVARFVVRAGPDGEAIVGLVGGNVIDAVRVGPGGKQLGVDGLREWVPIVAMYLVSPDKIEVASDGSDGTAVVRVSGPLVPFPTVFAFLSLTSPAATVTNEYRLKPDSTALEIATIVKPTEGKLDPPLIGDATFWSGGLALYRPGSGDPDSGLKAPSKPTYLGLAAVRADPTLMPAGIGFTAGVSTVEAGGILAFIQPTVPIPAEGVTIRRHLVIGGPGVPSLAGAMAVAGALSGQKTAPLQGSVQGMWAGVEVELVDKDDKPLTRCMPDAAGKFSCPAPLATTGARALWVGNGEGQAGGQAQLGPVSQVTVSSGKPMTVSLSAPKPGRLKVTVTSDKGESLPFQAVLRAKDSGGAGERTFIDGDGAATFLLPVGKWEVWLHHGPEWTAYTTEVALTADKETAVVAKLKHVVDTKGWIAADTHIHGEHSSDSDVPNRERVLDAVAVGLDYAVATDHDYITDYTPFLKAAGIQDRITVASGVEVSTAKWGHHGVWPIQPDPNKSGQGGPQWHEKNALQFVAEVRGGDAKRVHQVNHPRGSQSYFEGIEYDPKNAGKTDKKLLGFDAIELINSKRMDDTAEVLVDWFGLLDQGLTPTGVATSDTHSLSSGVGTARTWIWLGHGKDGKGLDRQGKFTAAQADEAIKAGFAVASTGPLLVLELMAGEVTKTVGETLTGAVGNVTARATVRAPDWMPLGKITLFRNGIEVHVAMVGDTPSVGGLREAEVLFSAPAATKAGWWVAVLQPLANEVRPPIQKRPVYAITNPVYEAPK